MKHVTTMQPWSLAMVRTPVRKKKILIIRCFADFQVFKEKNDMKLLL